MALKIIQRSGRRPLAPRESSLTKEFWQKLDNGVFSSTQCQDCHRLMFPPRQRCPACWSANIDWLILSGRGILYARTTIHAAPSVFQQQVPYSAGIIDLEEGLRLIATLIDDSGRIANDEAIQLVVLSYDDGPLFAVRRPLDD